MAAPVKGPSTADRVQRPRRSEHGVDPVEAVFKMIDESKMMMVDVFRKLDADGSGMIEVPELHKVLGRLGMSVSTGAAEAFFNVRQGSCA